MNTYKFSVELELEVEAFEFGDALEVVEEYFEDSIGELTILKSVVRHK
jgi:hypothetical protein